MIFASWGKQIRKFHSVCASDAVPQEVLACEPGWKAFRIEGVLDFSLIGVLSKLSGILAERKIGIFVVSTYNTDYIFTKTEQFECAAAALKDSGYSVEP